MAIAKSCILKSIGETVYPDNLSKLLLWNQQGNASFLNRLHVVNHRKLKSKLVLILKKDYCCWVPNNGNSEGICDLAINALFNEPTHHKTDFPVVSLERNLRKKTPIFTKIIQSNFLSQPLKIRNRPNYRNCWWYGNLEIPLASGYAWWG